VTILFLKIFLSQICDNFIFVFYFVTDLRHELQNKKIASNFILSDISHFKLPGNPK